jgi:PiT family inorganic phosphate transporter
MDDMLIIAAVIAMALVFDFVNGFHDAANAIATVVSTRVLSPQKAVIWAAFFNFIAFLAFGLHVATTIGTGVVAPSSVTISVIAAALAGAIAWDLIAWYGGIPASSSHALVGGLVGAGVAHAGFGVLVVEGLLKIGLLIFLTPLLGLAMGFACMTIISWLFKGWTFNKASQLFRTLQLLSAASYSLGHGGNDAQKTMGIILVVLIASGLQDIKEEVPLWVVLSCHAAMGLGTLAGGWRIVKTMGHKICELQPVHGFAAEIGGAFCLYGATWLGIPVSTTHTITGSILGVGTTKGKYAVHWGVGGRIVWAWILTIPTSAAIAAGLWYAFDLLGWR